MFNYILSYIDEKGEIIRETFWNYFNAKSFAEELEKSGYRAIRCDGCTDEKDWLVFELVNFTICYTQYGKRRKIKGYYWSYNGNRNTMEVVDSMKKMEDLSNVKYYQEPSTISFKKEIRKIKTIIQKKG